MPLPGPEAFQPRLRDWAPQLPLERVRLSLKAIEVVSLPVVPVEDTSIPTGPLELAQVDKLPIKIGGRLPAYPYWARATRAEGIVAVRFVVDARGNVGSVEIERVVGDTRFGAEAVKAITSWRFTPARYSNRPVAVWCVQRIQFKFDQ